MKTFRVEAVLVAHEDHLEAMGTRLKAFSDAAASLGFDLQKSNVAEVGAGHVEPSGPLRGYREIEVHGPE